MSPDLYNLMWWFYVLVKSYHSTFDLYCVFKCSTESYIALELLLKTREADVINAL